MESVKWPIAQYREPQSKGNTSNANLTRLRHESGSLEGWVERYNNDWVGGDDKDMGATFS